MQISDHYQILRPLGSGGDGSVYLVRHIPTDQLRAAKRIKMRTCQADFRELELMRHLKHPSLPMVYDAVSGAGEGWLIMEYIKGISLAELAGKRFDAEQFYDVADQLASVLQYLHTRKMPIHHLDVKPSNILIQKNGRLVLLDFGAAVCADMETGNGIRRGTPGFAAPEQSCIEEPVDERADVYGFGACLYYCLYRRTMQEDRRRVRGSLQYGKRKTKWEQHPVWQYGAKRLIKRCTAAERCLRYQDMAAVRRCIRRERQLQRIFGKLGSVAAAMVLLLLVLLFGLEEGLHSFGDDNAYEKEKIIQLLDISEGLGWTEAAVCYEEAAAYGKGQELWCPHLLGRILRDYQFDPAEEETVRKLLYSVAYGQITQEEAFRSTPKEYGAFAYRLGMAYWYFYEESGGKGAAVKWFEKALGCTGDSRKEGNDAPDWYLSAALHVKIGGYYERLGKQDVNGNEKENALVYWRDLKQLWEAEQCGKEAEEVRGKIAGELLRCLIMQAGDLRRLGEKERDICEILEAVQKYMEEWEAELSQKNRLVEQWQMARQAVRRAYCGKGGMLDGEKQTESVDTEV